jgi:hypothetical protein
LNNHFFFLNEEKEEEKQGKAKKQRSKNLQKRPGFDAPVCVVRRKGGWRRYEGAKKS